jgi:hypothetical protein
LFPSSVPIVGWGQRAPYFPQTNLHVSKEGYNVLSADVFDSLASLEQVSLDESHCQSHL